MSKQRWGGPRPGAGRRPKRDVSGVSHHARAAVSPRHPVQAILSTKPELGNLRKKTVHDAIRASLQAGLQARTSAGDHGGEFRVCHYSVQKHGLRLIVEASDRDALSRGIQGLSVRVAKALNRLWSRNGSVFSDRYATRTLHTGHEVRDSLRFVLCGARADPGQARKLAGRVDPYSSALYFDGWKEQPPAQPSMPMRTPPPGPRPVAAPRTTLLRQTWRKHGLIGIDEAPLA